MIHLKKHFMYQKGETKLIKLKFIKLINKLMINYDSF